MHLEGNKIGENEVGRADQPFCHSDCKFFGGIGKTVFVLQMYSGPQCRSRNLKFTFPFCQSSKPLLFISKCFKNSRYWKQNGPAPNMCLCNVDFLPPSSLGPRIHSLKMQTLGRNFSSERKKKREIF